MDDRRSRLISLVRQIEREDACSPLLADFRAFESSLPHVHDPVDGASRAHLRELHREWIEACGGVRACVENLADARRLYLRLSDEMQSLLPWLRAEQQRAVGLACYGSVWAGAVIWFHPYLAMAGPVLAMLLAWRAPWLEAAYLVKRACRRYTRILYLRQKAVLADYTAMAAACRASMISHLRELSER